MFWSLPNAFLLEYIGLDALSYQSLAGTLIFIIITFTNVAIAVYSEYIRVINNFLEKGEE